MIRHILITLCALSLAACGPLSGLMNNQPQPSPVPTKALPTVEPSATPLPTPTATPEPTEALIGNAQFVSGGCPFSFPGGEFTIDCGTLIVPEQRADPASRTIQIAVAILRSPNPDKAADPIVYLAGGPGGSALLEAGFWAASPLLTERDIILVDQRGTGYSSPQLDCANEANLQACADTARANNINLSAYNSAESAADLEDLRLALEIDEWNLIGISYGTRLALTYIRDFGQTESVRSLVLDGAYPLNVDAYTLQSLNTFEALGRLFDGCAADLECRQAYTEQLEPRFYDLVEAFEEDPVEVTLPDGSITQVTGDQLLFTVYDQMYDTPSIAYLPRLIADAEAGDYTLLAQAITGQPLSDEATALTAEGFSFPDQGRLSDSELTFYSVQCFEEVPFTNSAEAVVNTAGYPDVARDLLQTEVETLVATCRALDLPEPAGSETLPVTSDIPTLIMVGQYDPITPFAWAEIAQDSLPDSTIVEFPGVGHPAFDGGTCPSGIAQQFITNPQASVNLNCVGNMADPAWVLP